MKYIREKLRSGNPSVMLPPVSAKRRSSSSGGGSTQWEDLMLEYKPTDTLSLRAQLNARYGGYLASYLTAGFSARQLANTYNTFAGLAEQLMGLLVLGVGAWTVMHDAGFTIGMLVDFPPYGTTNAQNQPDGYDADVARLLAKDLGLKLNLVPVTGPNRIPFLLTNKVDLLVASLAVTPERAKQVTFSKPYSAATIVLYGSKKAAIKGAPDLKNFRIGVARARRRLDPLDPASGGAAYHQSLYRRRKLRSGPVRSGRRGPVGRSRCRG